MFLESGKSLSESSQRDPFGRTLAMLPSTHAGENGSHSPVPRRAVFSTRASPLHTALPIPSSLSQHLSYDVEIVGCVGKEGFNRRGSISVLCSTAPVLTPVMHRNRLHVRLGLNPCVTISRDFSRLKNKKRRDAVKRHLVTFPAAIKNIKERGPVQRDFLGKKVTSSVRIL